MSKGNNIVSEEQIAKLFNGISGISDGTIEQAQQWYLLKEKPSEKGGKVRHKAAMTVLLSAAAAIVLFAVISAIGITSSADWDNSAFGYLRRLFSAGLNVNEFSLTPQEAADFTLGREGFNMNGRSYSTSLTVKELLINGWEIVGKAREAAAVKDETRVRLFTDAYEMTDGSNSIIVYLNWEDTLSGLVTKECRVAALDCGKCTSFVTAGLELAGITREQLDYYNFDRNINCEYFIDCLGGDPLYAYYDFMGKADNGIRSAGLCVSREDPDAARLIISFDNCEYDWMEAYEISGVTDDTISFGSDISRTIYNSAVYSDDTPQVGDYLFISYYGDPFIEEGTLNINEPYSCYVARAVKADMVEKKDYENPRMLKDDMPERLALMESGLAGEWKSESEISLRFPNEEAADVSPKHLYLEFDTDYYRYDGKMYFQGKAWKIVNRLTGNYSYSDFCFAASDEEIELILGAYDLSSIEQSPVMLPYTFDTEGNLILTIDGTEYVFNSFDKAEQAAEAEDIDRVTPENQGPVLEEWIEGQLYAVAYDTRYTTGQIREYCEDAWTAQDPETAVQISADRPENARDALAEAIDSAEVYVRVDMPASVLDRTAEDPYNELVKELLQINMYRNLVNGINPVSFWLGYSWTAQEEDGRISILLTFAYRINEWSTLDPEITREDVMEARIKTARDFMDFRGCFPFLPSYSADDAVNLVRSILDNGRYYGIQNVLQGDRFSYPLEEFEWYVENIFHVTPEECRRAIDQIVQERNNGMYSVITDDGMIHGVAAGMPKPESGAAIDRVEYKNGLWYVYFHEFYYGDYGAVTDNNDNPGVVVMERVNYYGKWFWTFHSADTSYRR